ncbi:hypothetical protein [Halobaculum sp. MBLA0143]|uniref:hypothetical protein n=1 Tax=Halobaculum sp. MBLA0143 TaxID=3079933 RepID=UPI003523247B
MSNARRLFEVTVGGYLAAFLVSAAALVAGTVPFVGTIAVATVVVGAVGAGLARQSSLVRLLASPGVAAAATLAPLSLVWFPLTQSLSDGLLAASAVGVGASGLGLFAAATATYCRNRDRIAAATEYAAAEADDTSDGPFSGVGQGVAAASLAAAGIAIVVALLTFVGGDSSFGVVTALGSLSTLLTAFDGDPDRVAVTDAGVVADGSLYAPETITDVETTDDELVVSRTRFRPDLTIERDQFDDDAVDRLLAAVERIADTGDGVADTDDGADERRERERARG